MFIPLILVLTIFFGSQAWTKNYDVRYITSEQSKSTVIKKEFLPAGIYTVSHVVGRRVQTNDIYQADRYIVYVSLDGKEFESETNIEMYNTLQPNEEINVWYQTPYYWGDPFNVNILDPSNPNQVKQLEENQEIIRRAMGG